MKFWTIFQSFLMQNCRNLKLFSFLLHFYAENWHFKRFFQHFVCFLKGFFGFVIIFDSYLRFFPCQNDPKCNSDFLISLIFFTWVSTVISVLTLFRGEGRRGALKIFEWSRFFVKQLNFEGSYFKIG